MKGIVFVLKKIIEKSLYKFSDCLVNCSNN